MRKSIPIILVVLLITTTASARGLFRGRNNSGYSHGGRMPEIATPKDDSPPYGCELKLVQDVNRERTSRGLRPLTLDKDLLKSARVHCMRMCITRNMVHSGGPVAENIAMGYSTVSEAMRGWMNSSGHRANILNPRWSRIGVSAYHTANGTVYWCQQFK